MTAPIRSASCHDARSSLRSAHDCPSFLDSPWRLWSVRHRVSIALPFVEAISQAPRHAAGIESDQQHARLGP
jgi:hypothetical protein